MPGISVIDADGDIQEFADATTWHIDDRGQLHLNNDTGPVASFAKDRWQGAGASDSTVPAMSAPLDVARTLPLAISKREDGVYSIKLAGIELTGVLLSGGFSIQFKPRAEGVGPDHPEVTMVFASGALDLDLDAELSAYLRTVDSTEAPA